MALDSHVDALFLNPLPLFHRDCNRDTGIKALKRKGDINHESTLGLSPAHPELLIDDYGVQVAASEELRLAVRPWTEFDLLGTVCRTVVSTPLLGTV